jgi:cytochrome c biogenesis protein CcmG/thiol:disulfide interchange protein DsbE
MIRAIRRHLSVAGYLAVAFAALALACFGWRASDEGLGAGSSAASSGEVAPPFELPALGGGGSVALASYSGQAIVLNFWASWCGPCADEAQVLELASKRWSKDGVAFVGIDTRDSADAAEAFVEDHSIRYPIAADASGGTAASYGVTAMPQTFIISASGRVVNRTIGPVSQAKLDDLLRVATNQGSSAANEGA